jgi:hypothetical protein
VAEAAGAGCSIPPSVASSSPPRPSGARNDTSRLTLVRYPLAGSTGLPLAAIVSRLVTVDKTTLTERVGKLSAAKLELVLAGIDVVLGR